MRIVIVNIAKPVWYVNALRYHKAMAQSVVNNVHNIYTRKALFNHLNKTLRKTKQARLRAIRKMVMC